MKRARAFKADLEIPAHLERLSDGMRRFASGQATYSCPDLETLLTQSRPGGPTERWLRGLKERVIFIPFRHDTPPETVVLVFPTVGSSGQNGNATVEHALTKGELTTAPE